MLAIGTFLGQIVLVDVSTGDFLRVWRGHLDHVYSVSFSPDGTTLASGSDDNTARLWNISTGALLRTLDVPTSEAVSETIILEKFNIK